MMSCICSDERVRWCHMRLVVLVAARWIFANAIRSTGRSQRNRIVSQIVCLRHQCQEIVTLSANTIYILPLNVGLFSPIKQDNLSILG